MIVGAKYVLKNPAGFAKRYDLNKKIAEHLGDNEFEVTAMSLDGNVTEVYFDGDWWQIEDFGIDTWIGNIIEQDEYEYFAQTQAPKEHNIGPDNHVQLNTPEPKPEVKYEVLWSANHELFIIADKNLSLTEAQAKVKDLLEANPTSMAVISEFKAKYTAKKELIITEHKD